MSNTVKPGDLIVIGKPINEMAVRGIVISPSKKTCHVGETIEILDESGRIRDIPREYIYLVKEF